MNAGYIADPEPRGDGLLRITLLALCGMLDSHSSEAARTWRAIETPVRGAFGPRAEPMAAAMRANDLPAALTEAEHLARIAAGDDE